MKLLIRNEQEIPSTTNLSFYLSSALCKLYKQLRSWLCACFYALNTNKNPASVDKLIPCSFLLSFLLVFSLTEKALAEMEIITINNRPATDIENLLLPLLQPEERIIANGSNLIIRTTPERLVEIQGIIEKLDTPIENLIITVVQGHDISADQFNIAAKVQARITTNDKANQSFRFDAKSRKTKSKDQQENTQTLKTMDGQPAYIKVGSAHPIQDVQIHPTGYGYPALSTRTQYLETSTGFAVTPRLAGQDQVILDIAPWSDNFRNRKIDTQGLHTTIRTRLGEWIEIGGNTENYRSDATTLLSEVRTTRTQDMHVLIKVEKAN